MLLQILSNHESHIQSVFSLRHSQASLASSFSLTSTRKKVRNNFNSRLFLSICLAVSGGAQQAQNRSLKVQKNEQSGDKSRPSASPEGCLAKQDEDCWVIFFTLTLSKDFRISPSTSSMPLDLERMFCATKQCFSFWFCPYLEVSFTAPFQNWF